MLIRSAAMAQGWNQKRMAANLGISQQSAGYVVKGYVERVTFNQIFNYMICMDPQLNILVSMYPKMTAAIGQSRSLRESATSY